MDPIEQQRLYAAALNPLAPEMQNAGLPALASRGFNAAEQYARQPDNADLLRYAVRNSEAGAMPNVTGMAAPYATQLMRNLITPTAAWAARKMTGTPSGVPQQ